MADANMEVPLDYFTNEEIAAKERALYETSPLALVAVVRDRESTRLPRPQRGRALRALTRDEDGVAHAFLNYCRHRGAEPAHGCGNERRFTCPYHAWVYDTKGQLVGMPLRDRYDDLDMSRYGLVELPSEERHGFVWVVLRRDHPIDVAAHLGELDTEIGELGCDRMSYYSSIAEAPLAANWKSVAEGLLEGLHVPYVHADTFNLNPQAVNVDLAFSDAVGPHVRWGLPMFGKDEADAAAGHARRPSGGPRRASAASGSSRRGCCWPTSCTASSTPTSAPGRALDQSTFRYGWLSPVDGGSRRHAGARRRWRRACGACRRPGSAGVGRLRPRARARRARLRADRAQRTRRAAVPRDPGAPARVRRPAVRLTGTSEPVRLFDDAALERLARSPRRQLEDALASGDAASARALADSLERSMAGTIDGTRNWVTHTFGFAAQAPDPDLLGGLVQATQQFFAVFPDSLAPLATRRCRGETKPTTMTSSRASMRSSIDSRAGAGRAARLAQRVAVADLPPGWSRHARARVAVHRGAHPVRMDAHRHGAAPEKRLPSWVRMLQGHFSELRIEEDDEKFTIVQDPCGTCTRQIQQGRYEPPLDLAIIEERHATTWFRGDTPVYRAHVPLWHVTLAQELVGVPWPVNQCPAGLGTGPCAVLLYKDPHNPAAEGPRPTLTTRLTTRWSACRAGGGSAPWPPRCS